jgi:hypothetical protein
MGLDAPADEGAQRNKTWQELHASEEFGGARQFEGILRWLKLAHRLVPTCGRLRRYPTGRAKIVSQTQGSNPEEVHHSIAAAAYRANAVRGSPGQQMG